MEYLINKVKYCNMDGISIVAQKVNTKNVCKIVVNISRNGHTLPIAIPTTLCKDDPCESKEGVQELKMSDWELVHSLAIVLETLKQNMEKG